MAAGVVIAAGVAGGEILHSLSGTAKKAFRAIRPRPGQVLDLSVWKVGLPTTQEVKQPALDGFSTAAFEVVPAVTFTARCGDTPQPGSKYARSELREMNPDGSNAAWSTTSGQHTMRLRQRITHLPVVKPEVICAQIHSTTDYLIMVELSEQRLYVRYRDDTAGVLDEDYRLGTWFDLLIQVTDGLVEVSYNKTLRVRQPMAERNCYFKAGCYVQSSTSTGDAASAYASVDIAQLEVHHS